MNDCIYSCPNDTSKPELSLQVRTRNLECLGSNWHALRAWVWGLIAPKLARKTCQLTSRIDPRHKQTRLANVKVWKYKLPQEFNMIPNVQLMTKKTSRKYTKKKSYFLGKNCDGQNGHRMKLPVKTSPVTVILDFMVSYISSFVIRVMCGVGSAAFAVHIVKYACLRAFCAYFVILCCVMTDFFAVLFFHRLYCSLPVVN